MNTCDVNATREDIGGRGDGIIARLHFDEALEEMLQRHFHTRKLLEHLVRRTK